MVKNIIRVVAVILVSTNLWAQECGEDSVDLKLTSQTELTKNDALTEDDLIFYRVSDGLEISFRGSISTILPNLGEGRKEVYENSSDSMWDKIHYFFEGLRIGHWRHWDSVTYIHVTNSDFMTYRGIKVGDSADKLYEKYKTRIVGSRQYVRPSYYDSEEEASYAFGFRTEDGVVVDFVMMIEID